MTITAILGAAVLAALGWINCRVGGSLRYPPALFACWWSVLLLALACSGGAFYSISGATLAIYVMGPCAMAAGGIVALLWEGRVRNRMPNAGSWECRDRLLTISILALALAFPVYWFRIGELSVASGVRNFWVGVRLQTMNPDRAANTLGLFEYLIFFSTMVALTAFETWQRRKRCGVRAVAAIALSLAYHLVTASRLGALMLISGLIGIAFLHSRRTVTLLLVGALAVIPIFVTVAVALNKGTERGGDIQSNTASLARSFRLYALGGLVAFESAVDGTVAPATQGRTYRWIYAAARRAGYDVELPALVSQYAYTPTPTNVYTLYYPYFLDFGRAGLAVLVFGLGFLFSRIYCQARRLAAPFAVAYGLVFAYVLLSSADEYVFSLLSLNLQAAFYLLVLYRRPKPGVWNAAIR